ncbi:MAG: coproporphyrinogen-III oxidase family protein [Acidobacteriota bacterium]|jgi:oxygen-independent coproporphyrinogen-3 oxidase
MSPCEVQPTVVSADDEPDVGNYFVSAYPPFSTWRADKLDDFRRALAAGAAADAPLGLYVHVPFCVKRCPYCYYLSYAERSGDEIAAYVDAVLDEARMYARSEAIVGRAPAFLYFGGGTPSLLPDARIARLLDDLRATFGADAPREVTYECAPQSVTRAKLETLRAGGVTRLSMGVQQLDDDVLQASGRVHMVQDVQRAWEEVSRIGYEVVNLDLMVGMVGETEESFFSSLDRIIEMGPESVTLYQMEVPQNTPLYRELADGAIDEKPASWDTKHDRLEGAFARLEEAGYTVRSAYAAVRDPERHRFVYQDAQYRGADLIGLGVSSFSFLSGVHQQNIAALESYLEIVQRDEMPLGRAYALSDDELLVRELVLQLKLGEIDTGKLRTRYGIDPLERFAAPLAELQQAGWLLIDGDSIELTRAGLVRADRLLRRFYRPEHREVRYS